MNMRAFLPATAGLLGAAGVVAAAAAAHGGGSDTRLAAAAQILLAHAPAVLALAVARGVGGQPPRILSLAGWAMVVGAVLFSADMAARHFGGNSLFPMAAPLGGLVLIGAWLAAAVAFLVPRS